MARDAVRNIAAVIADEIQNGDRTGVVDEAPAEQSQDQAPVEQSENA